MRSKKYGLEYKDGKVKWFKSKQELKDALYFDIAFGQFETIGLIRDGGIIFYRIK